MNLIGKLRVKFYTAAWPQIAEMNTGFLTLLRQKYGVTIVGGDADIIFYENCEITPEASLLKVFITGENTWPDDATEFDIVIGFKDRLPNSYQLPLWTFSVDWNNDLSNAWDVAKLTGPRFNDLAKRSRFCGFVSCKHRAYRVNFVQKLSLYCQVTCAGTVLNNHAVIGAGKENKKEFLQTCKFAIAFENEGGHDQEGYVTEKIIDAFVAGAVPIYWGDPNISKVFNPRAFLNRRDYNSDEDFIEAIAKVDSNDELYREMQEQPIFCDGNIPLAYYPHSVCEKIVSMVKSAKNEPKLVFRYGAGKKFIDVSDTAKAIFVRSGYITVPQLCNFNALFGDVSPGVHKVLLIDNRYNSSVVTLPEFRKNDYIAPVTSTIQEMFPNQLQQ